VVIPVYKGEPFVDQLVDQLVLELEKITPDFEIWMVEDGGPDNSWSKIIENSKKERRLKGLQLSRNFGQHQAITAGLDHARGTWVIVMDCDLQDKPSEIHKLYAKAQQGYDIVLAGRSERQDNFLKRAFSKYFYIVLSYLTGTTIDPQVANFGIYSHKVIRQVVKMRESIRFFPMLIKWVGFKSCIIPVEHGARETGKSNYSFGKLFNLALNIMLAFSDKPLRLMVKMGVVISFFSLVFAAYNIIQYFRGIIYIKGFASLIVSIWFLSGVIISVVGLVGLYIGKIFEQTKERPLYIVNHTVNYE
jgi:dolichol-phosphate mannosyltransferase